MRLAIAIAQKNASSSAFVVWRGFEESIPKAKKFGFQGIELALKSSDDIAKDSLNRLLADNGLEVSCISTGQVFSVLGLYFTHPDKKRRKKAVQIFSGLINLAKDFGGLVNVGRARGFYSKTQTKKEVESLFIETTRILCDIAKPLGVTFLIEPVNRYEVNFINSVEQGAEILKKVDRPNIGLMPDLFHMNIEDPIMGETLVKYGSIIKYIHFSDSNRMSPGQGHIDFKEILSSLKKIGYNGWISVEILPQPDPDTAAQKAAELMLPLIGYYNCSKDYYDFLNKINSKH